MELSQLEYFVAVCETGSFSKAAEQKFLTQQALSKSMQKLSAELNVPLFLHEGRKIKPSDYGSWLLPKAKEMLRYRERIIRSIEEMRDQKFDCFRIGFMYGSYGTLKKYIEFPLSVFETKYPSVSVQLSEHENEELVEYLQRGELEAAYSINVIPSLWLEAKELYREPNCALISSGHPLASKTELLMQELAGIWFIYQAGIPGLEEMAGSIHDRYQGKVRKKDYSSFTSIVDEVRKGQGYTIASRSFLEQFNLENLTILPIIDFEPVCYQLLFPKELEKLPQTARDMIRDMCELKR